MTDEALKQSRMETEKDQVPGGVFQWQAQNVMVSEFRHFCGGGTDDFADQGVQFRWQHIPEDRGRGGRYTILLD